MKLNETNYEDIVLCSIIDCDNQAVVDSDKCEECLNVDIRLNKIWKQRTEEVILDDDLKDNQ